MILFHAKANGQVTTTPSLVPQGSSMQDLVVMSELDYALCTIKLEPASGIEIPDVVCTFIKTERGTTVWTAKLPPEAAKVAGRVTYSLEFTAADGTAQPTLSGSFTVPRRPKTTIPENVDGLKQYTVNELFALLSDIYASMTGSDAEIALLFDRLTSQGTVTIAPEQWTDAAPFRADVFMPDDVFGKGCVVLFAPEDDATKDAAGKAMLSMTIGGTVDQNTPSPDYVVIARAESGEAPTIPLNFRYVVLKTGAEDKALVAMIGVDAVGAGGASGGGNASVKSGYVSIPVSDWKDSSPTSATIHIDGFETGSVCLLTPADSATKTASEEARLSALPSSGISNSVFIIRAQAGKVPTTQLNFKYMILRSEDDTGTPLAAIIGIDAAGSAEVGSVDETAVKNIIESVVPEWARADTKPTYSKDDVGLGNVDNVKQYSGSNPPDYPVDSVNGKTGAVKLNADDVGARSSSWMPTAAQVGADPSGTAATKVSEHDTYTGSHNDIRLLIKALQEQVNKFLDVDDTTRDELSEVLALIDANAGTLESLTSSKVNVTDIINNLTTNVTNKPLSAAQGVALKALIDALSTGKLDASALGPAITTALKQAKESGEFDCEDEVYVGDGDMPDGAVLQIVIEEDEETDDEETGGESSFVQSDWNQTDETAADFIKNKPFGNELVELMPETKIVGVDADGLFGVTLSFPLEYIPETLVFVFDGVEYVCDNNVSLAAAIGVTALYGNSVFIGGEDTGEPFGFAPMEMVLIDGEPHTLSISELISINVPERYLNHKKLYFKQGGDNYLYTDSTCTNKATIVDVPDSADFVVAMSSGIVAMRWYKPIVVDSRLFAQVNGHCNVIVMNGSEIINLHTAEYASTT